MLRENPNGIRDGTKDLLKKVLRTNAKTRGALDWEGAGIVQVKSVRLISYPGWMIR